MAQGRRQRRKQARALLNGAALGAGGTMMLLCRDNSQTQAFQIQTLPHRGSQAGHAAPAGQNRGPHREAQVLANQAAAPGVALVAVGLGAVQATVALARGRRSDRGRTARRAGFLSNIKDFLKKNLNTPEDDRSGPETQADGVKIRVSSNMSIGQPFCGEYQEQPLKCYGRSVFMKLGLPANSQAVYLLFNSANQWAFTPHGDGRPDGWAYVADEVENPTEIRGAFSIWDGSTWLEDNTIRLSDPSVKAEPAIQVESQPSGLKEAEALAAKAQAEVEAAPSPKKAQATGLPEDVQPLSMLHWKSHWAASQRARIEWSEAPPGLETKSLRCHPGVRRGVLPNGMRYVVLRNAMPPKRFEAHIELHVGSIDEEPNEQGIAHMMEHVCFLGSRKRERLIGTGSRSNALTDFQHTIYHIHAPCQLEDGRNMYYPSLEALQEIAFAPEMLNNRIEKERKAVLAEMQQVNDMEYRIETWTLSGLHETNKLGTQFPIGKEEQIKAWQQKDLRHFHDKWYYPGNATLYVVGDLEESEMIKGIEKVFSSSPAKHKPSKDSAIMEPVWGQASADARSLFRRKIARPRPDQLHNFSLPMIGTKDVFTEAASFDPKTGGQPWHGPLRIFRNELLEGLQLNFYSKTPVRPLRTYEDIRHLIGVRILVGVLQFRIVSRYSSNHAPVQIDHSDSFREGCAVTSVTVNADPRDWRNALACVVQEIRAICDYGITESEMHRYMEAMLKDVEKGVQENDTVPSEDHLNFVMTSDVFDHVVMHPEQSYEAFREVAPTVTMEQLQTTAKWMLGFVGYYGLAAAPPSTAIVVCTPTQVFEEHSGQWTPFNITEQEIVELLTTVPDKSREEAMNQVDVPESLLAGEKLDKLLGPGPVAAAAAWRASSRRVDEATGIVQLMLPNGARVNYACTSNESQGTMRMLVPGGKSADEPDHNGSSMVGIRTISESGAVSDYSREQIELFAVSNLMSVHLDLNTEFSYIDASFTNTSGGFTAVLELLHLLFLEPRWEVPAFVRAQQAYKAQSYAVKKSLEQSTLDRLMRMMYSDLRIGEARIEDLNKLTLAQVRQAVSSQLRPQDLEINIVADFEGKGQSKMAAVEGALSTGKHHRGDDAVEAEEVVELPAAAKERRLQELDEALWKYLGSIPASETPQGKFDRPPQINRGDALSPEDRQRTAHLEDSDERAIANIGGGAPNRWGKGDEYHSEVMGKNSFSWDYPNSPMKDHPLYPSMCLLAMREVINTRLFSTVRDSLGLSYDCSFELSMLDRLEAGFYTMTVSAHPSRIMEAVEAAKGVLQGVKRRPISELEVSTARRTLLRRHETDLQSNEYWISLLTHLQYENPKDISCVRDIETMLKALTWRDLQNAYQTLLTDPEQLFVSVCTAGPGSSFISGGSAPAAVSTSTQKQLIEVD